MPKPKNERGAPNTAKRIEQHEADAEDEVNRIKEQLSALRELIQPNGEKETQAALNDQISKLQRDLEGAYDLWFKLSKQVREFDKAVAVERREGEKVLVMDAKEIFAQYQLSILTAIESYIVSISQKSALCESPEEFYTAHSDAIKTAIDTAINAAKTDGVIPAWIQ